MKVVQVRLRLTKTDHEVKGTSSNVKEKDAMCWNIDLRFFLPEILLILRWNGHIFLLFISNTKSAGIWGFSIILSVLLSLVLTVRLLHFPVSFPTIDEISPTKYFLPVGGEGSCKTCESSSEYVRRRLVGVGHLSVSATR